MKNRHIFLLLAALILSMPIGAQRLYEISSQTAKQARPQGAIITTTGTKTYSPSEATVSFSQGYTGSFIVSTPSYSISTPFTTADPIAQTPVVKRRADNDDDDDDEIPGKNPGEPGEVMPITDIIPLAILALLYLLLGHLKKSTTGEY